MKIPVSIISCRTYAFEEVRSALGRAVDLVGGMEALGARGKRILIKPNLLFGKPPEAAITTHPAIVRAAVRLVKEAGGIPIVGDSPALGTARKAAERSGVLDVCESEGAEFVDLNDAVTVENPSGLKFKRLQIAGTVAGVDAIINLPKLKTHAQMYITAGVKNIFGCVPGKLKVQWHLSAGVDIAHFSDMLLDLCLYVKPRLTILDAVVGMEGNGPGNGEPRQLGFVAASVDPVALDCAAALCLGADPADLPILRAAAARGVRGAEEQDITVVGDGIEALRVRDFKFPPPVSVNFADRLPYFIERPLRKALTSRPVVDAAACTLCNVCVEVCPVAVMKKSSRIEINYDSCIRCYCCQEICPHGAIAPVDGWLKRLLPGM